MEIQFGFAPVLGQEVGSRARLALLITLLTIPYLGPSDGLFCDDHIPAYFVEDGRETLDLNFQIVCFLNGDGKINKVTGNPQPQRWGWISPCC